MSNVWNPIDAKTMNTIDAIAQRACTFDNALRHSHVRTDIMLCHTGPAPLDLDRMLAARDFDFMHDVYGIARHLFRGELEGNFWPRFAKRQ